MFVAYRTAKNLKTAFFVIAQRVRQPFPVRSSALSYFRHLAHTSSSFYESWLLHRAYVRNLSHPLAPNSHLEAPWAQGNLCIHSYARGALPRQRLIIYILICCCPEATYRPSACICLSHKRCQEDIHPDSTYLLYASPEPLIIWGPYTSIIGTTYVRVYTEALSVSALRKSTLYT